MIRKEAFPRWIRFLAGPILLALVIVTSVFLLRSWRDSRPLPEPVLKQAWAGITRSEEWQPVIRRLDTLNLTLVPAGCFQMGSTDAQLRVAVDSCERFFGKGKCQVDFVQSETPAHEVCFDSPFWIGQTEVTNRQYGSSSSTDSINMYRAPSWPRENVTWEEAGRYCASHNARLPTEAEWEYAARGPDARIYPWGDAFDLKNVISGRLQPGDVASVRAGVSWIGAFDLSGGVAEWVADVYAPYGQADAQDPVERRVVRGGSWFSFADFYLRSAQREAYAPGTKNSTIGFRCARDFE